MNIPNSATSSNSRQESSFEVLEEIFSLVSQAPEPQRDALLKQLCPDTELREQARKLLDADAATDQLVDKSLLPQPISFPTGHRIGPYKLLQQIGQGGMGVVYMAEQLSPIRRKVAIKIVKPGVDARDMLARFDAERQALSMMDHPNIARVLDAGRTETGSPFFVMELVKGQSITEYCAQNRLSPRERLQLFQSVCHAIHHAHQKGIIHRDIKPSNVLVAEYDGHPVVKVIDFGVSKGINQPMTELTMFTAFGQIIGTFEYMSPEQSRVNQLDVDTRSDIYSLGVLLYELLTGSVPFDKQRLRTAAWDEMLRIIREEDPPKPSTRLSDNARPKADRQQRKDESEKLSRFVRGELDWIVMKAMEKDRNRRYDTPNDLAKDIDCFLNGAAVAACPPSLGYRCKKFVRRNKVLLATSCIVAIALISGLIATSWQAFRATRAESAALAERDLKETARRDAVKNLEKAKTAAEAEKRARMAESEQRQRAEAAEKNAKAQAAVTSLVNNFLVNDLLGLAGSKEQLSAGMKPDPDLKLVTLLERARARVDERFEGQPRGIANLKSILATSFYSIGRYEEAAQLLEEVLEHLKTSNGAEAPETLRAMNNLAANYIQLDRDDEAEPLFVAVLETRNRTLGAEHAETLNSMSNLALFYKRKRQYDQAESLYRKCLELEKQVLGPDDPQTLKTINNLSLLLSEQGRCDEAVKLCGEALATSQQQLGPDHPDTLTLINNLALMLKKQERYREAEALSSQGLEIRRNTQGPEHPDTLTAMSNLAKLYMSLEQFSEARPLLVHVLETQLRELGADHPQTATAMRNMAVFQWDSGNPDEAEPMLERALAIRKTALGENHPDTIDALAHLGLLHVKKGRVDRGLPLLESAYRGGSDFPEFRWVGRQLAKTYADTGRREEAVQVVHEQFETACAQLNENAPQLSNEMTNAGLQLLEIQAWPEAEAMMRNCLRVHQQQTPDSWRAFDARSMLGEALFHQQEYPEAELLLVEGYDGLNQRAESIPQNTYLTRALNRLIAFYDALENEDKAAFYRAELEAFDPDSP